MDLSIAEQLALVAQSADGEFRLALMWVCLAGLGAIIAFCAIFLARNAVSRLCRLIRFLGPVGVVLAGPFYVKMVSYGGSKGPLWRFTFENGVHNIGSYCTNDTIHASWDYAPAYGDYTLRSAYRDLTFTNEVGVCLDEWHQLDDVPVSDMEADWNVPNATNMEVVCYALYVRPPDTHTNGTYQVYGTVRTLATTNSTRPDYVTPNVRTYGVGDDGETRELNRIEPPPESLNDLLSDGLRQGANPNINGGEGEPDPQQE